MSLLAPPWTESELDDVWCLYPHWPTELLASYLGRTEWAVKKQARKLRAYRTRPPVAPEIIPSDDPWEDEPDDHDEVLRRASRVRGDRAEGRRWRVPTCRVHKDRSL